jgi:RNA polymerase sigma-70 factor (ECF subfamily)
VDELITEAAARWPGVIVDPEAVRAACAAKELEPTVDGLAEIYLALACERGDAAAIAAFERAYLDVVPVALAGMRLPTATIEDVRAAVRDKLLAGGTLLAYAGRGRLRGLVQVTATRTAIDRIRRESREVALPGGMAAPGDLELSLIKAQYREAFVAGFAAAVQGLSQRERNLMHLHFLGGVTLERLAQMYGVHRATIVRWLAAARESVLAATRAHVAATLHAPAEELDEMFALVQSRVELSLDRLLASVHVP